MFSRVRKLDPKLHADPEGGEMHADRSASTNAPLYAQGLPIQRKLTVNAPGDAYEQEAERMAERVMNAQPAGGATPTAGRLQRTSYSPYSPDEGTIGEDETIQRASAGGDGGTVAPSIASRIEGLSGRGEPLSSETRARMEPHFGSDFGDVRVHTDGEAAALAHAVEARAFTLGSSIVFDAGQYAPQTHDGQRLLAHELAHVFQQDRGTIRRVRWNPNTDSGNDTRPWGSGPNGDVLHAATDVGTPIDIWRPHDGATYWCHGYTFGGSRARGGPYSVWGQFVPTIINDDGWQQTFACMASPGDVLVFFDAANRALHSGIVRHVSSSGGAVDETTSTVQSKWGQAALNTSSWAANLTEYRGTRYRAYSKSPLTGVCNGSGAHEMP